MTLLTSSSIAAHAPLIARVPPRTQLDGRNFDKQSDGGMAAPFCHGQTAPETFLSDAAAVIRDDVMARDPTSINFNITALCKPE